MKNCLLSPRLIKIKNEKTNKSSQILEDLSKYETSEYLSPSTLRCKKKKRRGKSSLIYEDSGHLLKTSPASHKKNLSPKRLPKQDSSGKDQEDKVKKLVIKEKLKKTNEKIRRKNANCRKVDFKHPLPWGADQRIIQKKKNEPESVLVRVKTDRHPSRRAQRKEIGLDMYSNVKVKSKTFNKSEEKPKNKRSPDPIVLNYMKQKKKNEKLLKIKAKVEENLREKERIKALTNLEKTQLKKIKKKKRKKAKVSGNDEEKSTDPAVSVRNKDVSRGKLAKNFSLEAGLFKKLKNDKRWKVFLPIEQVVKIQRWFRKNRSKFKSSKETGAYNASTNFSNTFKGFSLENYTGQERFSENSLGNAFLSTDVKTVPDDCPPVKKVQKLTQSSLCHIIQAKDHSYEIVENSLDDDLNRANYIENPEFEPFNVDSLESFSSQDQLVSQLDLDIQESPQIEILTSAITEKDKIPAQITLEEQFPPTEVKILPKHSNSSSNSSNSSRSSSSNYKDAENSLKKIFENRGKPVETLGKSLERPGIIMKDESDSSEEEWNSNTVVIHADTTISEQTLETLEYKQRYFLADYDPEIQILIRLEIDDFLDMVKFKIRPKEVDESFDFIRKVVLHIFTLLKADEQDFIKKINIPVYPDPLLKLKTLQIVAVGDMIPEVNLKQVLPKPVIEKALKAFGKSEILTIYVKMITDVLNEALNSSLPFYPKGFPLPWSSVAPFFIPKSILGLIVSSTLRSLESWESIQAGIFPVHSNCEEFSEKSREEKLNLLLLENIREQEPQWTIYEDEETQLMIDISDLVFEYLIEETFLLM